MASLTKDQASVLDLAKFSGEEPDLRRVILECAAGRPPPLTPDNFDKALVLKTFTSRNADLENVKKLYRKAFALRMSAVEQLEYTGLHWGDDEAARLAEVLQWVLEEDGSTSLPELQSISLVRNRIGDAGVRALAESLRVEGAAPRLRHVYLAGNKASADTMRSVGQHRAKGHAPVKVSF